MFQIGDTVSDPDGERPGVVVRIGDADEVSGRRYLVQETNGATTPKWRNEPNLMKGRSHD